MNEPDHRRRVASARTLLFVPGHRPDRFAKAAAAGADGIVLDLEDAVAPHTKDEARDHVLAWLSDGNTGIVRINAPATPWYDRDVAALADRPRTVMLPKAERPDQIADLLARLPPGSSVVPLLETAAGVLDARAVLAVPGVIRAGFGSVDLAAELGVDPDDSTALAYTRSHLVLASAAAGVAPPLDGVTTALHDEGALVIDAERAATLGYTGKLCVHPRQVPAVNGVFTPSDAEREQAREIVRAAADRAADGAVTVVNGRMVDRPVLEWARRLLSRP